MSFLELTGASVSLHGVDIQSAGFENLSNTTHARQLGKNFKLPTDAFQTTVPLEYWIECNSGGAHGNM